MQSVSNARTWRLGVVAVGLVALAAVSCTPDPGGGTTTTTSSTTTTVAASDTASFSSGYGTITVKGPAGSNVTIGSASDVSAAPGQKCSTAYRVRVTGVPVGSVVETVPVFPYQVAKLKLLQGSTWVDFTDDGDTGAVITGGGSGAVIRARDGGRGDADGVADGKVEELLLPEAVTCAADSASLGAAGGSAWGGGTVSGPSGTNVTVATGASLIGGGSPAEHRLCASDLAAAGIAPGSVMSFTVSFPRSVDQVLYVDHSTGGYEVFGDDGTTGASIAAGGMSATLEVRDGGRGDLDGTANGSVCVQIGLNRGLKISVGALPTAVVGEPYSASVTTSGASGPLVWKSIPAGAGGLLGTSYDFRMGPGSELHGGVTYFGLPALTVPGSPIPLPTGSGDVELPLQVVDGESIAVRTIEVAVSTKAVGPTSVGTTLPSGHSMDVIASGSSSSFWRIDADGTTAATSGPVDPGLSPDGSKVVVFNCTAPCQSAGGVGTYDVQVLTTGGTLIRELQFTGSPGTPITSSAPVWAPSSDEFVVGTTTAADGTTEVRIVSSSDTTGAGDRVVHVAVRGTAGIGVLGWSTTGRLAIARPSGLVYFQFSGQYRTTDVLTVSAATGGDIHWIRSGIVGPGAAFSPDGQYLAFAVPTSWSFAVPTGTGGGFFPSSASPAFAPDADQPDTTTLSGFTASSGGAFPVGVLAWR